MRSRLAAERRRILKRDPLSVADPPHSARTASNAELQARLASAVHDFTRRANIDLDGSAQDYVGTLISRTTERLGTEGLLQSPHAAQEAEEAFMLLLRRTAARCRNGTLGRQGISPGIVLTKASVKRSLAGVCPLWPIC